MAKEHWAETHQIYRIENERFAILVYSPRQWDRKKYIAQFVTMDPQRNRFTKTCDSFEEAEKLCVGALVELLRREPGI
jgi:hypothetical protein